MVAVNRENGESDVDVLVFVVDSRPTETSQVRFSNSSRRKLRIERAHVASLAIPIPASLINSRLIGRSPMHFSLRAEIVW